MCCFSQNKKKKERQSCFKCENTKLTNGLFQQNNKKRKELADVFWDFENCDFEKRNDFFSFSKRNTKQKEGDFFKIGCFLSFSRFRTETTKTKARMFAISFLFHFFFVFFENEN